ncbi:unnamed protein product [Meloidogyne enterolobii]|uniref:Uncharacterized protein n=1 Tax=Meloidogyne enterolobii TaxID=390850 RepID=A0ACB0XK15_MELEN
MLAFADIFKTVPGIHTHAFSHKQLRLPSIAVLLETAPYLFKLLLTLCDSPWNSYTAL